MRIPVRNKKREAPENTIALINVVFLMLIFFLIAGSIAPPMEEAVELIQSAGSKPIQPPDALFVTEDGALLYRGNPVTAKEHVAFLNGDVSRFQSTQGGPSDLESAGNGGGAVLKLCSDAKLPATRLIDVLEELKNAGAGKILIIAERKP